MKRLVIALGAALVLAGCNEQPSLDKFVLEHRSGSVPDYWIEMKSIYGEWERMGLIFGYLDDYEECTKAIAGLKSVNTSREYRCTPAN